MAAKKRIRSDRVEEAIETVEAVNELLNAEKVEKALEDAVAAAVPTVEEEAFLVEVGVEIPALTDDDALDFAAAVPVGGDLVVFDIPNQRKGLLDELMAKGFGGPSRGVGRLYALKRER